MDPHSGHRHGWEHALGGSLALTIANCYADYDASSNIDVSALAFSVGVANRERTLTECVVIPDIESGSHDRKADPIDDRIAVRDATGTAGLGRSDCATGCDCRQARSEG